MTPTEITFAGQNILLLPQGAVFIPDTQTLVVADLHFEKGTAGRSYGALLPPGDTACTLDRLEALLDHVCPKTFIALGDSFHDKNATTRLTHSDRVRLNRVADKTEIIWIAGNHDAKPADGIRGDWRYAYERNRCIFRHIPSIDIPVGGGEISGHLHPKLRFRIRGHTMSRRCFVVSENRLILPAFGTYTGGLNVDHEEFQILFPAGKLCFLLGSSKLYKVFVDPLGVASVKPR